MRASWAVAATVGVLGAACALVLVDCKELSCEDLANCPLTGGPGQGGAGAQGGGPVGGSSSNCEPGSCASGLCADGVCCDTACDGVCVACNLPGTEGLCTPIASGADPASECGEGVCDGSGSCAEGGLLWAHGFAANGADAAYGIAADGAGNVLFSGQFVSNLDFGGAPFSASDYDVFLAKLGPDGDHVWSKHWAASNTQGWVQVAVDPAGESVISGAFMGSLSFDGGSTVHVSKTVEAAAIGDLFVAAFDAGGAYRWSQAFGDSAMEIPSDVALDSAGSVLLTGMFAGDVTFGQDTLVATGYSGFLVKLTSNLGYAAWSLGFGTGYAAGSGVAGDSANNIVLSGTFNESLNLGGDTLTTSGANDSDVFVAKFATTGAHLWSRSFGDPNPEGGARVAIDGNDHIVLASNFMGHINFGGEELVAAGDNDVFVAKLDADGNHLWSRSFGDALPDQAAELALDPSGNVLVGGWFEGTIDFGGGVLTATGGGQDGFVVKLDRDGNHLWSRMLDAAGAGNAAPIVAAGPAHGVFVGGHYDSAMDVGDTTPLEHVDLTDLFLAKYAP